MDLVSNHANNTGRIPPPSASLFCKSRPGLFPLVVINTLSKPSSLLPASHSVVGASHHARMAQYRQLGNGLRNGVFSDHVSIGVRGPLRHLPHRRSKPPQAYRLSLGCCVVTLSLILSVSAFFYLALQGKGGETNRKQHQDNGVVEMSIDTDFLTNVTRTQKSDELKFGHESIGYGRDSRYWDKDDRRRDNDYDEGKSEEAWDDSVDKVRTKVNSGDNKPSVNVSHKVLGQQGNGLYNEAGRNELKMYEAEYEASLKDNERSTYVQGERNSQSGDTARRHHKALNDADEYDDGIDLQDDQMEEYDDGGHDEKALTGAAIETKQSSHAYHNENRKQNNADEADKDSSILFGKETLSVSQHSQDQSNSGEDQQTQKLKLGKRSVSKKKPKRRKFSGTCEMKTLNSSSLLVEPLQSRKFARFSLQYTEKEEKAIDDDNWEPRFAGHQSLGERKESFIAQDQKINCGFVKGPSGSPSTGFDIAEDDAKYISSCHIAVMSCIFGNSDRLRSPLGKTVSRFSRKNVCFVMFVDEVTLQTISSEGQMPDMMGFVGLWKLVVVKNLPCTDMRRVGKIPKFLPHRLFTSARYSIWLDSKLRLQLDPIVILEYFLWRKGHEYAISNHYDRHCLWEEVSQNKKLNKYNHSVIDEQFAFYQADGMRRFNASDSNKLLPSNVPEGSVIIRAHTSMSNLFSCLWFNEVDRFTPRDQLSFAYTYHKLRWMNPEKPFYMNMFKDCERRKIAKLYHHRSTDRRNNLELKE